MWSQVTWIFKGTILLCAQEFARSANMMAYVSVTYKQATSVTVFLIIYVCDIHNFYDNFVTKFYGSDRAEAACNWISGIFKRFCALHLLQSKLLGEMTL